MALPSKPVRSPGLSRKFCHPDIIAKVSEAAQELGLSQRKMISGAVHDALMLAKYCPTGMIFVPSKNGISHNAAEFTSPEQLGAGANVLLHTILKLSRAAG